MRADWYKKSVETLASIYERYASHDVMQGSDKGTVHSYVEEYERLLAPYRQGSTVLEIGVMSGASMQMWQEYFVDSTVIGVDVTDRLLQERYKTPPFHLVISDSTNPEILKKLQGHTFDVVMDDGCHIAEAQIRTFFLLKPMMRPGSLYIIEDVAYIDHVGRVFRSMHPTCEIIDNRHVKGRSDDVLVIYRF